MNESSVGELLGEIDKQAKVQVWISKEIWAMPLSVGWIGSYKHFFLQILCFNITIDF